MFVRKHTRGQWCWNLFVQRLFFWFFDVVRNTEIAITFRHYLKRKIPMLNENANTKRASSKYAKYQRHFLSWMRCKSIFVGCWRNRHYRDHVRILIPGELLVCNRLSVSLCPLFWTHKFLVGGLNPTQPHSNVVSASRHVPWIFNVRQCLKLTLLSRNCTFVYSNL